MSDSEDNDVFSVNKDLVPPAPIKPAGVSEINFDGLLSPPLRLHEDLKNGCGGQLWPAGMVLSKYMLRKQAGNLADKSILELGAGGGLVGLAVALGCNVNTTLHVTDQEPMFELMKQNIALNDLNSRVEASIYDWGTPTPSQLPAHPDIILAADCVYFEPAFPLLQQTLKDLIGKKTVCFFCFKRRRRADLQFMKTARKMFKVEEVEDDPDKKVSRFFATIPRAKTATYFLHGNTTPPSRWPLAPLIVPPASNVHKSTFIILHGRGSTADKFASPLLTHLVATTAGAASSNSSTGSSDAVVIEQQQQQRTFQSYFPDSKFIFPTARRLRARACNRSLTHQWFDSYPFDSSHSTDYKSHIQTPGLRDSVRYVHELLNDAVREVGGENVVLMGLSMGCATALVSLLLWNGEKLGGVLGMCGWLPFVKEINEAILVNERTSDGGEDIFERDAKDGGDIRTTVEIVIEYLREELDLVDTGAHVSSVKDCLPINIPVFLGHGPKDDKVPVKYGQEAAKILQNIGIDVEWKEYEELHHWYSSDMLRDIITFLRENKFDC